MTGDRIFLPAIGSERGVGEIFPIDAHAPRGIFETPDGNIYLVCDSPGSRSALALKHHSHEPFLMFDLNHTPVDFGVWLGVGKIVLIDDGGAGCEEGVLLVEEQLAQIYTVQEPTRLYLQTIAHGWCADTFGRFGIWGLAIEDRIVFQNDTWGQYLPEQLAAKIRELMS